MHNSKNSIWAVNAVLLDNNAHQESVIILVFCEDIELCKAHIQHYIQVHATRLKVDFLPLPFETYRQRHGDSEDLLREAKRLNVSTPVIVFHPQNRPIIKEASTPCLIKTSISIRENSNDTLLSGVPDTIASRFWQGGSACYAVIHAVKSFWFPSDFLESGLRSACLYEGDAADDYENSAPYLVELPLKHDFTQRLFSENPPNSEVNFNHWGKNAGIFLRSQASFESLLAHFRRFIYMPTYDDRLLYFRFFDSAVLTQYLDIITCYPEKLATFFGGGLIDAYAACDNDHFIDFVPSIDLSMQEKEKKQFDELEMQIFIAQYDEKLLQQVSASLIKDFPEFSTRYDADAIYQVVESNFELAKRYKMRLTGSIYLLASYQLILGQPVGELDEQDIFSDVLNSDEEEQTKIYHLKKRMTALTQTGGSNG